MSGPSMLRRSLSPATAASVLSMMESTTTIGTSRSEFFGKRRAPALPGIRVAAKTGTLRGENPPGINNWFIGAAPIEQPRVAVAVIVVNPLGASTKASHLGRLVLQRFFSTGRTGF